MLRYQQYIELVRTQEQIKLLESVSHAKKYLLPFHATYPHEVQQACALLAFPPGTRAPAYAVFLSLALTWENLTILQRLYNQDRWETLAQLFSQTHNTLLSLPSSPLLQLALSAGLSALKTPSCHSQNKRSTIHSCHIHASSFTAPICPICSTELNTLAKDVPYAHHTKSHVASDLVMLPNGRVYRKPWLEEYSMKAGLNEEKVKDVIDNSIYSKKELKKLFIS